MRYDCDGFTLELPDGWLNTTEGSSAPFTLSKPDGVGALQFTVGLWRSGEVPSPDSSSLHEMLIRFAQRHTVGKAIDLCLEESPIPLAAASYSLDEETFLRAWFLSDGTSFAQVTYVCSKCAGEAEVPECENIVRSISFTRYVA